MVIQYATHKGTTAPSHQKGSVEKSHPFPFFTLRGNIADICLSDGLYKTGSHTLQ